jgi:hypothetical protein
LNVGTRDYCGFKDVTSRIFHDVALDMPESIRQACLDEARTLAAKL